MEAVEVGGGVKRSWDRQPGENNRWYARFVTYRDVGPERSLLGLYNSQRVKAGKSRKRRTPKSWSEAAKRFAWVERARAFDDYRQLKQEEEAFVLRRQEQEHLFHTREEHRKHELELARKLLEKADPLLSLPVLKLQKEEVMENGTVVQILVPNHNAFRVAAVLVSEFSRVGRLALGLPERHTRLDLKQLSTSDLLNLYEQIIAEEAGGNLADQEF